MGKKNKGIDTFHHVVMRGARGLNIVENNAGRWDFNRLLFYLNDVYKNNNWERDIFLSQCDIFERPAYWPMQDHLVYILAYCLHDNHFHLLVKEIREGGISQFMHRVPNSMTRRYNNKYESKGSLFQGTYKSRQIDTDADLENVAMYIMIKNVFERFPEGGISAAPVKFRKAYQWAMSDPFSSFADYAGERESPIIKKDLLHSFFPTPSVFKERAREYMKWREEREGAMSGLILE